MATIVNVPVDEDLTDAAAETLDEMGLSPSDAVRILFTRIVADRAFPLELKVPNADTVDAMAEAERLARDKARFETADALFRSLDDEGR